MFRSPMNKRCNHAGERTSDVLQQLDLARYDEKATWLDQLEPAFGERCCFFEQASAGKRLLLQH